MRSFCARRICFPGLAALGATSTTRAWCSAAAKPEGHQNGEEAKGEKGDAGEFTAQLEESKKALEEVRKELAYRTDDAENARRIGREDVDKARQFGVTSFAKDMLEVADTLDKGVEAFAKLPTELLSKDKALDSVYRGMKQSLKILHSNMSQHGIERMGVSVGTPFDFNFHEALTRMPPTDKAPANTVCHVLKDGYTIKTRVLRAAQVAVSSDEMY